MRTPIDRELSIAEFGRQRIGYEAQQWLLDALVTGIFAGDSEQLSYQYCFPKLHAMIRESGSLFAAQLKSAWNKSGKIGKLTAPRAGMGAICDRILTSVPHFRHEHGFAASTSAGHASVNPDFTAADDHTPESQRPRVELFLKTQIASINTCQAPSGAHKMSTWSVSTATGEQFHANKLVLAGSVREQGRLLQDLDPLAEKLTELRWRRQCRHAGISPC